MRVRRRRRDRAHRRALPVRPAARDAARDLRPQPAADPGDAHAVRRPERRSREPVVDERRHPAAAEPDPALEPHLHHRVRTRRRRAGVGAAQHDAPRPVRPRGHAEPRDGRLRRRAHGARRHARVRARRRRRGARRRCALADRQRRSRPRAGVHRRLVHGGRAGRRRPARRHDRRLVRARHPEQVPRAVHRRRAREDRRAGADRAVHPAPPAGAVRAEGPARRKHDATTCSFSGAFRTAIAVDPRAARTRRQASTSHGPERAREPLLRTREPAAILSLRLDVRSGSSNCVLVPVAALVCPPTRRSR